QAEDGIRDFHVTGVQTCALPISTHHIWVSTERSDGRAGRAPRQRPAERHRGTAPPTGGSGYPRDRLHRDQRISFLIRTRRADTEIGRATCRETALIVDGASHILI